MTDCPNLVSEMCTPKVFWHQTDWSVGLRIMLCGVDDYFLFVDNDHLRFRLVTNSFFVRFLRECTKDLLFNSNTRFSAQYATIENTISAFIYLVRLFRKSVRIRM